MTLRLLVQGCSQQAAHFALLLNELNMSEPSLQAEDPVVSCSRYHAAMPTASHLLCSGLATYKGTTHPAKRQHCYGSLCVLAFEFGLLGSADGLVTQQIYAFGQDHAYFEAISKRPNYKVSNRHNVNTDLISHTCTKYYARMLN